MQEGQRTLRNGNWKYSAASQPGYPQEALEYLDDADLVPSVVLEAKQEGEQKFGMTMSENLQRQLLYRREKFQETKDLI